jgi:hypothetical protein
MAGAPNASSGSTVRRCATASAAPPTCSASAIKAAQIHSRREGFGSPSKSGIAALEFTIRIVVSSGLNRTLNQGFV